MRKLTKKQKKLLTKWYNESYDINLTVEQWNILEDINDSEILWQEVNRFLLDMETTRHLGIKLNEDVCIYTLQRDTMARGK